MHCTTKFDGEPQRILPSTMKYSTIIQVKNIRQSQTIGELEKFDQKVVDNLNGVTIPADPKEQKLAKIKGHLVEYPLMWLHKDPFKKDIRLKVLDTSVFY